MVSCERGMLVVSNRTQWVPDMSGPFQVAVTATPADKNGTIALNNRFSYLGGSRYERAVVREDNPNTGGATSSAVGFNGSKTYFPIEP